MRAPSTMSATAVAVAMNASRSTSKPRRAAARIPPWFPTSPPRSPDAAPPTSAAPRPRKRRRCDRPVRLLIPAKSSKAANTIARTALCTTACRAAPASPPIALARPNPTSTSRSMCVRTRRKRTAVPTKWGSDTAAIARRTSTCVESTGVRMLPIPKPATAATAPAAIAAPRATAVKRSMPKD